MKGIDADFDALVETAKEKLKPSGWEEIEKLREGYAELSPEDKAKVDAATAAYNRELCECLNEELGRDCDADIAKVTAEGFDALCAANPDWTAEGVMQLEDTVC